MKTKRLIIQVLLSTILFIFLFGCSSDDNEGIFDANETTGNTGADAIDNDGVASKFSKVSFSDDFLINEGEVFLIKLNGEFISSTISVDGQATLDLPIDEPYLLVVPKVIDDLITWDQDFKLLIGFPNNKTSIEINGNHITTTASKKYLNSISVVVLDSILSGSADLKLIGSDLVSFQTVLNKFIESNYNSFVEAEVLKLSQLNNGNSLFNADLFTNENFSSRIDETTIASTGQLLLEQLDGEIDLISTSASSIPQKAKSLLDDPSFQVAVIESLVLYNLDNDNTLTASSYFESIIEDAQVFEDLSASILTFQMLVNDFKSKILSTEVTREELTELIKATIQPNPIQITIE